MKSISLRIIVVTIVVLISWALPATAQTNTTMSVQSETSAVETGQYYTLTIYLQDVIDVWQINAELEYDPALVYVIGTAAGSPMSAGDFFTGEPTIVIRNGIRAGHLEYTHSLVSPANPKSGSGIVATFQIYPLSAGTTQIRFSAVDLTKINFIVGDDGIRNIDNTEDLPVLPALLELTISGETVEPPDESTATPKPTATADLVGRGGEATVEPTLVNVTLVPDLMPTLIPEIESSNTSGDIPILPIAIGLVLIAVVGGIGLVFVSRRS